MVAGWCNTKADKSTADTSDQTDGFDEDYLDMNSFNTTSYRWLEIRSEKWGQMQKEKARQIQSRSTSKGASDAANEVTHENEPRLAVPSCHGRAVYRG